ncbi:hypothetical protein [Streptomyces sp. NBC_01727]|uniref:hypothetical protein n=1 Tax=unclassified Streptomyces TaxID=2593676 RepID=UPI002E10CF42|nr:hypothetical protein OIE76_38085 [Streptomyces sp. NBC_01727]
MTDFRPHGHDLTETSHHIAVTSDTDVTGYVDALNRDLAPLGATARAGGLDAGGDMVVTLNALSLILTLMLVAVHHAAELLPLALGGVLIATLGALLPAGWAARARTATDDLRTE